MNLGPQNYFYRQGAKKDADDLCGGMEKMDNSMRTMDIGLHREMKIMGINLRDEIRRSEATSNRWQPRSLTKRRHQMVLSQVLDLDTAR